MSKDFDVIQLEIDEAFVQGLDSRLRNQLMGCMHAHNELAVLNRVFMFGTSPVEGGELANFGGLSSDVVLAPSACQEAIRDMGYGHQTVSGRAARGQCDCRAEAGSPGQPRLAQGLFWRERSSLKTKSYSHYSGQNRFSLMTS